MSDGTSKKLYQSIFAKHIRDAIKHPNKKTKSYELIRKEFKEFIKIDINFKYIPIKITEKMLELIDKAEISTQELMDYEQKKDDEIRNFQESYISNIHSDHEITLYNQLSHFRDIPESFKDYLKNEGEKTSKLIKTHKSPKHSKQITILEFKDLEESLKLEIFNYFDWLKEQKNCNFFEISQCMNYTIDHSSCLISPEQASEFGLQVSKILFKSKCKLKRFFISDCDLLHADSLCKEIWFFSLWFTKSLEFTISELEVKVTGANGFFTVSRECFFSTFMGGLCDAYKNDWTHTLSSGESASLLIELEREIVTDNFKAFNNSLEKYRDQAGILSFTEDEIEFIGTFFIGGKQFKHFLGQGFLEEVFESISYIPQLSKVVFTYLIRQKSEINIFFITGPFYIEPLKFLDDLKAFHTILNKGNHERLAQSFIMLNILKILRSVKIKNSIWLKIIHLINDTLDPTQKEKIISFLNFFAPENSELRIELDDNYQNQNIYQNEVIKPNVEDEASSFYENILLSQFSKDQILKYFKNLRINERENLNNYDNILLPLFKAAEDHLSLYLTDQGIEFGRSTDLSNLMNRLQDHIKSSSSMSNFKSKWRKVKGKFFRIIRIRNQTAHASIYFEKSQIGPTEENVKKFLCFIEELRQ